MSSRIRIVWDNRGLEQIMRLPEVRAALHNKAEEIAKVARTIAASEIDDGFAAEIRVLDETRPSGRPVAKVEATRADAAAREWGSTNTQRRRVLGRAGGVQPETIFPHRADRP